MSKPLRVLIVEDSENDALILVRELRRGGFEPEFDRVETAEAMTRALAQRQWDLILSDYNMPQFSGIAALELFKRTGLDLPFIVVSGSIGEDLAVAAMKAGAHDYLMKGNIKRLIPSIERELREAEVRKQHLQAEEALRDSEARKAAIFDSALDSIITIDLDGIIVEFNPEAEKTFGYNRREAVGRRIAELIIPASVRDKHQRVFSRLIATGRSSIFGKRIELSAMRSDGSEFPVELSLTSISSKARPLITAYIRDLTEQKKQEEIRERSRQLEELNLRIQEANRLKSEFLANMSHELRTPLNGIIGFSQMMYDEQVGPVSAQHKEFLGDILASGQHLLQLINDVLDLAKIEAGKMELYPETFALGIVVDEVCALMGPLAAKRSITISVDLPRADETVSLDLRKFKQVLYNLLSNAVKFSHEKGVIKLVIAFDGDEWLNIEVTDTGIGIKDEDLPRIFREFEQLDSGASRRFGGTGLGLALTKKIVELHNGSIRVQSEFGKGSTFTIRMPRHVTAPGQPFVESRRRLTARGL